MRVLQVCLLLSFSALSLFAGQAGDSDVTVSGTLSRVMAIGGESTGWSIQLDKPLPRGGSNLQFVEIHFGDQTKLESLANKHVEATGRLEQKPGVELAVRTILDLASVRETSADEAASAGNPLAGSEWLLEDLAGAGVIDNVQATLAFSADAKVSGHGSCNRFFGPARVNGSALKIGPLGSTRMGCPEAIMHQEDKYMKALESTTRFERKAGKLLLYIVASEKPLRFSALHPPAAADQAVDLALLSGRIWRLQSGNERAAPGSIYIFLTNGTLLQTSCVETYRISLWAADTQQPSTLHFVEDGHSVISAHVLELTADALRMQQTMLRSQEQRTLAFEALKSEFVCPDLPK